MKALLIVEVEYNEGPIAIRDWVLWRDVTLTELQVLRDWKQAIIERTEPSTERTI